MKGKIRLGIVGACGRGRSFKTASDALAESVEIRAACDANKEKLPEAAKLLGAPEQYTDYDEMLEKSDLDAVVIGTPMPLHVPQAIAALKRNLHVLSEVPAGVSVEECRELVEKARTSSGIYMMAENYTYIRTNVLVRELVRRGLFGATYYAEGEYIHELKGLNEVTRWRRRWQTGIDGITYGTHSLGAILQWMPGDRVAEVSCAGSGHHYRDPRGDAYENQDSCVMLCRMKSGGLVKVRVDMLSDRPHSMTNYQLQGTDGCYESARAPGERHRIWLRSRNLGKDEWTDLATLEEEFLPEDWKRHMAVAAKAGHGGGDYFEVLDFVEAIQGKRPAPIGIDEAMDMTLPGLVSQQSIRQGGRWLAVPDPRRWGPGRTTTQQLHMLWRQDRLDAPPEVRLPEGYELRQFHITDSAAYGKLMAGGGFIGWDEARIGATLESVLPDGFFLIEHRPGCELVATAMATHHPAELHPFAGELGWVAGDSAHKGKGLGTAVVVAATARFLRAGYRRIYLKTDDWRLPAIMIYLRLGYEPFLYQPDMAPRWKEICTRLNWPFTPERWPRPGRQ